MTCSTRATGGAANYAIRSSGEHYAVGGNEQGIGARFHHNITYEWSRFFTASRPCIYLVSQEDGNVFLQKKKSQSLRHFGLVAGYSTEYLPHSGWLIVAMLSRLHARGGHIDDLVTADSSIAKVVWR